MKKGRNKLPNNEETKQQQITTTEMLPITIKRAEPNTKRMEVLNNAVNVVIELYNSVEDDVKKSYRSDYDSIFLNALIVLIGERVGYSGSSDNYDDISRIDCYPICDNLPKIEVYTYEYYDDLKHSQSTLVSIGKGVDEIFYSLGEIDQLLEGNN